MPLPGDYLAYPHRRPGPDHDRYPASPIATRPPITLPGGIRLGIWLTVLVEFFPLNPSGVPFKAPGAMQTPYPDLRHYTTRDYGNRVGIYRMLTVLERLGLRATFAVQGAVAARAPGLVADILSGGHEVAAHGWDTDAIHHSGLDPAVERRYVADTLDAIAAAGAPRPTGWLSPARSQGFATPERLVEAGIRWCADWAHDDLPTPFRTDAGPMAALPLSPELDDWQILSVYRRPEAEWVAQVGDAASWLAGEAARSGPRILSLTVRPYILGQPYRVRAFRESLDRALAAGAGMPVGAVVGADLAAAA